MKAPILDVPTEILNQIFGYLLPDRPIGAWLDHPLRKDGSRIDAFSLLLVNRRFYEHVSSLLYGGQEFFMNLTAHAITLAGVKHYSEGFPTPKWPTNYDKSCNGVGPVPSNQCYYVGPRFPDYPAILKKIRSLRIQIVLEKPHVGRPRRRRFHGQRTRATEAAALHKQISNIIGFLKDRQSFKDLSVVYLYNHNFPEAMKIGLPCPQSTDVRMHLDCFKAIRGVENPKLDPLQICCGNYLSNPHYVDQPIVESKRRFNTDEYGTEAMRQIEERGFLFYAIVRRPPHAEIGCMCFSADNVEATLIDKAEWEESLKYVAEWEESLRS